MSLEIAEIGHFTLVVLLPILVVMGILGFAVRRLQTPKEMRWPRKKRKGRRRSERDI